MFAQFRFPRPLCAWFHFPRHFERLDFVSVAKPPCCDVGSAWLGTSTEQAGQFGYRLSERFKVQLSNLTPEWGGRNPVPGGRNSVV